MRQCIERQRNSRCGIAIQSLAFFQKNALMYLWHRTSQREKNLEAFNKKGGSQANFLAEFLSLYNRLANNAQFTEAQQEQWRRFFTETSLRHPMFNDLNETITLQFLDKEERSPSLLARHGLGSSLSRNHTTGQERRHRPAASTWAIEHPILPNTLHNEKHTQNLLTNRSRRELIRQGKNASFARYKTA